MQTLLDMFNESEKRLSQGQKGLQDLKSIYSSRKKQRKSSEFSFHMKTLFTAVRSLDAKSVDIERSKESQRLERLEFNPTISDPEIVITDKRAKAYSAWYMPNIYVPSRNSAKRITPEYLVMEGERRSIYEENEKLKRDLYTYEFLSDSLLKENSKKLLNKMNNVKLVMHVKNKFKPSDLSKIKDSAHYLKPENLLVVSEQELSKEIKMNLPPGTRFKDKIDLNLRKLENEIKETLI